MTLLIAHSHFLWFMPCEINRKHWTIPKQTPSSESWSRKTQRNRYASYGRWGDTSNRFALPEWLVLDCTTSDVSLAPFTPDAITNILTLMDPLLSKSFFSSKQLLLLILFSGNINKEDEHSVWIVGKILSARVLACCLYIRYFQPDLWKFSVSSD